MGNTPSHDIPVLPKQALGQQLSFLNVLHYDIVTQIISYMTQRDCLNCMAVCRDWYHTIPQYSQNIWQEIELNKQDASVSYLRRQQCLGHHVKHVVITEVQDEKKQDSLAALMQRLADWNCTKLESLELISCISRNQNNLFDSLKHFGSCLTHLKLDGHYPALPMKSILEACPELTHLFYIHSFRALKDGQVSHHLTNISQTTSIKLTHLFLNIDIFDKKQLEDTLKRCPELRCYVGMTCSSRPPFVINLDSLLSWCPKINYLVNSINSSSNGLDDFPDTSDETGLCHLNTMDCGGSDQMLRCLKINQHTLKHLLCPEPTIDSNWTPIFTSLSLPNLALLKLESINCDTATLIAFLNRCPLLETLVLYCRSTMSINTSELVLLHSMEHLNDLFLTCETNDSLCVSTMLEKLPALENLSLSGCTLSCLTPFVCSPQLKGLRLIDIKWMRDDIDPVEREAKFVEFLRQLTYQANLEAVHIDITMSIMGVQSLTTIASIPTIKNLDLQYDPHLTSSELEEFLRLLSNTKIETLELRDVHSLSFDAFNALATLPLLNSFCANTYTPDDAYTEIAKDGLQHLLCASPNLDTVRFSFCKIVADNKFMNQKQAAAFIQKQTPKCGTTSTNSGHWDVTYNDGRSKESEWLEDMVIERRY